MKPKARQWLSEILESNRDSEFCPLRLDHQKPRMDEVLISLDLDGTRMARVNLGLRYFRGSTMTVDALVTNCVRVRSGPRTRNSRHCSSGITVTKSNHSWPITEFRRLGVFQIGGED